MAGADRRESVVNRGFAHAAAGLVLAEGVMGGVEQAEALADARLQVLAIALKRHVAPDIDFPEIHRWSGGRESTRR